MEAETPTSDSIYNWTSSLEVSQTGEYDDLQEEVVQVVEEGISLSDVINRDSHPDEDWDSLGQDFATGTRLYEDSLEADRYQIAAAWWGDNKWIYSKQLATDGLWDEELPARTAAVSRVSKFVLSGALGQSILNESKSLHEQSLELPGSRLDAAILIGGAALVGLSSDYRAGARGASCLGAPVADGMMPVIWTGGDFHGDFRTARHLRPVGAVSDTVDPKRRHSFMPVADQEMVAAYHGPEPGIVGGLLYHLVANVGVNASELRERILTKLSAESISVGGDFGDYGDKNGRLEANRLRFMLDSKDQVVKSSELFSYIVVPGSDLRFKLAAGNDTVIFRNEQDGESGVEMIIPNNEIEEYITTLVRGGGGRTSPQAMINVIDALKRN